MRLIRSAKQGGEYYVFKVLVFLTIIPPCKTAQGRWLMAHKDVPADQIIPKEALCLESASSYFAGGGC